VVVATLMLLLTTPAHAEIRFRGPTQLFEAGSAPRSIVIADLDRDGHSDLVLANSNNNSWPSPTLSILDGNGDGTFAPRREIAMTGVPQAVVVRDLDRDGLLDLAVTVHLLDPTGRVSVLLGRGDGTFDPPVDHAAGTRRRSLNAVDLDADGDLDLVTEGSVHLGNGNGTFQAFADHGSPWGYATVGDVDGDGRPDLVTSNFFAEQRYGDEPADEAFTVRRGNGDGTFQAPVPHGVGDATHGLEIADLDADGRADLVVCNAGYQREGCGVSVFLGNGDGTFQPRRFFETGLNPVHVAIADLDGDGKLDLATANVGEDPDDWNTVSVLFGNGDGTFRRANDLQVGDDPVCVVAGRLDPDATIDLVVANGGSGSVSVFLGNGDGTFGTPDLPMRRPPLGLAAADLNRDGRPDLAMTMGGPFSGPAGGVLPGRGEGAFGDLLDFPAMTGRGFVGVTNLDGDPAQDLVFIAGTGMAAMLGNGDGTFRTSFETSLLPTQVPGIPACADFDRDGRTDVAVPLNHEADAISILLGRGDGTFESAVRIPTARTPQSAAAGDLNGDGNPDLVLGHTGYLVSVSVLLGAGDGTFAPQVPYGGGDYSASPIALVDLDADGRLDVVAGNSVWLGNGDGTLRRGTRVSAVGEVSGVALEDLDGDRHVDLVLLFGEEQRIVSVYPGNGDGTFGTRVDFGTGSWPRSMAVGDWDGDGRVDLAVANGSSSISIYLNRSEAPVIPVRFELRPAVLHPRAEARWVTGVLTTTEPHAVADIDIASIRLNGVVPVDRAAPGPRGRGTREMVVRFDHAALMAALPRGEQVPVKVTGTMNGDSFEGSATVRVLGGGVSPSRMARHQLALRVLVPVRPETGSLRLGITLAEEAAARVDVIDVAGRVMFTRPLESLVAGPQVIELAGPRSLAPGVYFVRLRQGAHEARARLAVVR
jgi:hypothetical protein